MSPKNTYARADSRTRSAKAAGYPARSVYKLREIDKRYRIFRRGQCVLDLGAAPGSWAMYAAEKVGSAGCVVAVDRRPIATPLPAAIVTLEADVSDPEFVQNDAVVSRGPFDVVLSDMAPKTTGTKFRDRVLSFELFMAALAIATKVGKEGSTFVGKIFMSQDFPEAKSAVQTAYAKYKAVKPSGTRPNSSEIYVVGIGRR